MKKILILSMVLVSQCPTLAYAQECDYNCQENQRIDMDEQEADQRRSWDKVEEGWAAKKGDYKAAEEWQEKGRTEDNY